MKVGIVKFHMHESKNSNYAHTGQNHYIDKPYTFHQFNLTLNLFLATNVNLY
jgi:hypothetical protein